MRFISFEKHSRISFKDDDTHIPYIRVSYAAQTVHGQVWWEQGLHFGHKRIEDGSRWESVSYDELKEAQCGYIESSDQLDQPVVCIIIQCKAIWEPWHGCKLHILTGWLRDYGIIWWKRAQEARVDHWNDRIISGPDSDQYWYFQWVDKYTQGSGLKISKERQNGERLQDGLGNTEKGEMLGVGQLHGLHS